MKRACYLPSLGVVCALGSGQREVAQRLFEGDTAGMLVEDGLLLSASSPVGRVAGVLPEVPGSLQMLDSRNNRLLLAAVTQIRPAIDAVLCRFGRERIGVVIGTSTSGIAEGEAAVAAFRKAGVLPPGYHYAQQELGSPAAFLSRVVDARGPAYVLSTACTSSAKAFVAARRLLRQQVCDAVIVGGVDSLCRLTLNGFAALESISPALCNPMSVNRSGINIGEAAAVMVMTRDEADIEFLGTGETSDAYHMSAPHPEGVGAEAAMRAALRDAGLAASDVDYLNMHATATVKNDAMESLAIDRVFAGVPVSGTKPLSGHALGAAGALELAFCWLSLQYGQLPPHVWDGAADPEMPALDWVTKGRRFARKAGRACMSNSFAFGGSNVSLLIGDAR